MSKKYHKRRWQNLNAREFSYSIKEYLSSVDIDKGHFKGQRTNIYMT